MAEETISILNVNVDPAVTSIKELRDNISLLKKKLNETQIDSAEGWKEYQKTLAELKVNQNALKDAAYATNGSFEGLIASAKGASNTYNSLVHRMADLKTQLRSTDVSTEQGKQKFRELAGQINEVNDQLKEMDALQGNFQRNVGNYASHWKGMSESIKDFGDGLDIANGHINGFAKGIGAIGKSPAIATFAILLSVVSKLAESLKENETASASFKKGLDALQPVMDFFSGLLEKVAVHLADIIEKVVTFVTSNGLLTKVVNGVVGVGNAILKYVISPFKGIVKAIEVLQEEGVKGLRNAAKAFGDEMKNGISFRQNFENGKIIADSIISGAKSRKKEVNDAGVDLGKQMGEGIKQGLELSDWKKALAEGDRKLAEAEKQRLQDQKEIDKLTEDELARTTAEIDKYFAEQERIRERDTRDAKEKAKEKIASLQDVADSTAGILDAIAGFYESDEEHQEENAKRLKALRIATATIDTINGAITAFMSSASNPVRAAIKAAAVTAAGVAQIAKIRSTRISGSSAPSASIAPAVTNAPSTDADIPQVRNITSASEEDRLNQLTSEQRVVLVMSDLEVKQNQTRVQVAESSF